MKDTETEDWLRCSFCHKRQEVVEKLISTPASYPRAYICGECIAICQAILEDDKPPVPRSQESDHRRIPVSQTIQLPPELWIPAAEVYIRKDSRTGDIILSQAPAEME